MLTLFRLDTAQPPLQPDALMQGIARHIAVAPLTQIVMQIGERQQCYLALTGCAGCVQQQCMPGCRVELLRRTCRAAFGWAGVLHPVAKGLAQRPYTRVTIARPTPHAQSLDPALLDSYSDARLIINWHPGRAYPTVSAMMLVGADGPAPDIMLRKQGWSTLTPPKSLIPHLTRYAAASQPRTIRIGKRWNHRPFVMLLTLLVTKQSEAIRSEPAIPGEQSVSHDAPESSVRAKTYAHLRDILDGRSINEAAPLPVTVPDLAEDAQPSRWPCGPGIGKAALSPMALETAIMRLLNDPAVTQGDEPGVTRKRIAAHLDERHKEHAAHLLAWLDQAGLLLPPRDTNTPFRHPRALATHDPLQIAAGLKSVSND